MSSDHHLFGASFRPPPRSPAPDRAQRIDVLNQTLIALDTPAKRHAYRESAKTNLTAWRSAAQAGVGGSSTESKSLDLRVVTGDWGDVTQSATKEFGTIFAALNMANERWPGGSYRWGSPAQEENMFRRSDCHFSLLPSMFADISQRTEYNEEMQAMVAGENGVVYLDTTSPRVCIRGSENASVRDGRRGYYEWYDLNDVFPFFELRSAAVNFRGKSASDAHTESMQKRIDAQLDTLILANVRHVILGAFGCGSFRNSPKVVAGLYKRAIQARRECFDVIIFAIYDAGDDPSQNFTVFEDVILS
jgi:hypothetical protein